VQPGADVRLGRPKHARDLRVREAARELECDQVALVARESGEGGAHGLAPQRELSLILRRDRERVVGRLGLERDSALSPTKLVERGVAGDAEEPGLVGPARRAEASSAAARSRTSDAT
jgi:hypothetical protein